MFSYYVDLAIRSFRRSPVLTALMVLAIAVGIGASMTTLTVRLLLSGDPLPGKSAQLYYPQLDPETGADVRHNPPDRLDYISAHDLWQSGKADRQTLLIDKLIKVLPTQAGQSPFMSKLLGTTSDFFPMFRVPFRYGAAWRATDEARGARQVVISETLNQRLFGGANSVGHDTVLNGHSVRIVGVLAHWRPRPLFFMVWGARGGGDTSSYYGPPPDVYLPLPTALDVEAGASDFNAFTCWGMPTGNDQRNSLCNWVSLWVELDTAAKAVSYRDYLDHYDAQQRALGRLTHPAHTRLMSLPKWLDYQRIVPADVKLQSLYGFGFLAVCLFNTIGLLLAKFMRRSGEIGVRRALGASRRAIFAQCLVEAGSIGLVGGVFGLLLTMLGLWVVRQQGLAYADLVTLDVSTFVLAVVTSLLAGAFPAMRASAVPPALQLKSQ